MAGGDQKPGGIPRLGLGLVKPAEGLASARSGPLTERSGQLTARDSARTPRKTPRELTGLTPRELGVSEKSFRLDDLNDSDVSSSDDESINSSIIASPRPPLPKTPRGSGGLTPRGGSHTPRGGLASPTGTRSLRPGSATGVTFDVPESVPESDLEHTPGSPIESWEVLDTQQRTSDANANDVATLPAVGSPFAAGSATASAAPAVDTDKEPAPAPAQVPPGGGEAARVFSAALKQEDAGTGTAAHPAAALGVGAAAEPGSPPVAARVDGTPEHSPIKPHSGRSPTPLIVDQLLSDMMEDAFTPRGTHRSYPPGSRSLPPAGAAAVLPVISEAQAGGPAAAAVGGGQSPSPVSAPPPTAEELVSQPDDQPVPEPPTAGKRDSEERPKAPAAPEAASTSPFATQQPDASFAPAAEASAPVAAAPITSKLDPDAPAFEPSLGVEKSEVSSLAAGADQYEERMQTLAGADSRDVPPPGQIGVETAQPVVVEKSHISSLASGADRFERNMRHLAGQYSMKGPLGSQQLDDATVEPIPESPAQGTPTADAAAAEGSSLTQRSSYSPLAMLGAAGAGIAAVGTAAAAAVKSTLSPAKPDAAQQQGQPEPQHDEPLRQAAVPSTLAAGSVDTPAADTEERDTAQFLPADMPKDPQQPQPTPQDQDPSALGDAGAMSSSPEALVSKTTSLGSSAASPGKPPMGTSADELSGSPSRTAAARLTQQPGDAGSPKMALYASAAPTMAPGAAATMALAPTALSGSEEKPLQEVLPEVSPEGAAGPATASDVDVSGGLGPPPETPPRPVSDLAAGVPITPAPSLESQGDRPRSLSDLPKAPPPTPVSGVATAQVPPASMSMPTAENMVLASPANSAELPDAPPPAPADSGPGASRLSVSSSAAGRAPEFGSSRAQGAGTLAQEASAQSAPQGVSDPTPDAAEEHKPAGMSPLAALGAVGAGIAAVGTAAVVAVKQTVLPESSTAGPEQLKDVQPAGPAGSGTDGAPGPEEPAVAAEPPATYTPAAAQLMPADGAAPEPASLATAGGVAAAAKDAADLERPSGAAPPIAPGPPPGVGTKGADERAVADLDAAAVEAAGAPLPGSADKMAMGPATMSSMRRASSTSTSSIGPPPGVGQKHADEVMPEDLRPEDVSHGHPHSSPPPSLPPVEDDQEELDGDDAAGASGSTARGGAAAGPPTLEARSTPLPPVAELPPINTSTEEGMGSGAAAAAAPELMTGMGKLHISTDSGADGASPEGSIVDGASPMSLAAGADFADQELENLKTGGGGEAEDAAAAARLGEAASPQQGTDTEFSPQGRVVQLADLPASALPTTDSAPPVTAASASVKTISESAHSTQGPAAAPPAGSPLAVGSGSQSPIQDSPTRPRGVSPSGSAGSLGGAEAAPFVSSVPGGSKTTNPGMRPSEVAAALGAAPAARLGNSKSSLSAGADRADQALAALHGHNSPGASQHSGTGASAILEGSHEGVSSEAASPVSPATISSPKGAPPVAAALPMPADPQPAGSAGAAAPAAGTEVAAHTVGAFAPEVSVKPVAGAGANKISPIAEPTAEAAEARTLATETAPGQGPQGAAGSDGAAVTPVAGAAPPVATAANSSLVTATGDSFDLPKPHDASHELAAGEGLSSAADGQAHKGTQASAPVVEATTQSPTAAATDNSGAAQPAAAPADATQRSEIQAASPAAAPKPAAARPPVREDKVKSKGCLCFG